MAQVLAVISGKGGTGKTSLCAGVASCLAMEGQRVLCVDLDVGLRNLDIALGMADMAVLPFTSVMRGEYSLQQASQHPTIGNLSMLTAPVTESAEAVDTEAFERLITQARDGFDWILLDAPAGVGRLFRMAVRCADEAMLVTLPGPASQRDAAHTAELLLQERQIPARLVVNRTVPKLFACMRSTAWDCRCSAWYRTMHLSRWLRQRESRSYNIPTTARRWPACISQSGCADSAFR